MAVVRAYRANSKSSIAVTASESRRDPAQPSRLLKKKNMWVPVVSEPPDTVLEVRRCPVVRLSC